RCVSLPNDVLLTNWATGELMRAAPGVWVDTRHGPDYGMRIVPGKPGGICILGPESRELAADGRRPTVTAYPTATPNQGRDPLRTMSGNGRRLQRAALGFLE